MLLCQEKTPTDTGVDKAYADPAERRKGGVNHGESQTYSKFKISVGSFGLDSILLTEVRILNSCYGMGSDFANNYREALMESRGRGRKQLI
jgi:hypothetical protein